MKLFRQLLTAVMKIKDAEGKTLEEKGYDEDFFEDRICTLHHYCKHKLMRREVFTEKNNKDFATIYVEKTQGFECQKKKL